MSLCSGHSLLVLGADLPPPAVLEQVTVHRQPRKDRWLEKAPIPEEPSYGWEDEIRRCEQYKHTVMSEN